MLQPVTLALIAITALVSWRAFSDRRLLDRMILWPPAVARQREYWRLLTHGFLHADFPHLLFNMFTLFFFGGLIERLMTGITGSRVTFLLFYLSAIVVAILPSYLKNIGNPRYFSLGASGAVSAVLVRLHHGQAVVADPGVLRADAGDRLRRVLRRLQHLDGPPRWRQHQPQRAPGRRRLRRAVHGGDGAGSPGAVLAAAAQPPLRLSGDHLP